MEEQTEEVRVCPCCGETYTYKFVYCPNCGQVCTEGK